MAAVVKQDFGGVRVQFQGDRVQALFHLPKGDEKKIAERAVDTAIALQSSMELVIKKLLPEAAGLGIAVGISMGTTLVSKLGTRGHRDRICIGDAVEDAATSRKAVIAERSPSLLACMTSSMRRFRRCFPTAGSGYLSCIQSDPRKGGARPQSLTVSADSPCSASAAGTSI